MCTSSERHVSKFLDVAWDYDETCVRIDSDCIDKCAHIYAENNQYIIVYFYNPFELTFSQAIANSIDNNSVFRERFDHDNKHTFLYIYVALYSKSFSHPLKKFEIAEGFPSLKCSVLFESMRAVNIKSRYLSLYG